MQIAVIGVGNVGGSLARLWSEAGHLVQTARSQGVAASDIATTAEVVALCVPWPAAEAALASCGDLSGKIIIDCTNPLLPTLEGLILGGTTSGAERLQELHPEATVVKAFNSLGAALLGSGEVDGQLADGFLCGDDTLAKSTVALLVAAAGLRPVDVGPLRNARYLEAMAMLWIDLAVNQRRGPTFTFNLVSREQQEAS